MVFDYVASVNVTKLLWDCWNWLEGTVISSVTVPCKPERDPVSVGPLPPVSTSDNNVNNRDSVLWYARDTLWACFQVVRTALNYVHGTVTPYARYLTEVLDFTEFQLVLLKVFSTVLLLIAGLTVLCWRRYGTIITNRFIRPSTAKEIEQLKLSVAKLKLPKEHTPRI